MSLWESILAALDSLRANLFRTALTMLGISIGVAAVIVLIAMGEGTKSYISNEFYSLGTNLIIVQPGRTETKSPLGPPPGAANRDLTIQDVRALERHGTLLSAVSPLMMGSATISIAGRQRDVMVLGTDDSLPSILSIGMANGRFYSENDSFAGRRVCTIGWVVKEELFGDATPIGSNVRFARSEFRVIGVMEKKGTSLGMDFDDIIFMPVRAYQKLFDQSALFGIRAKARSQEDLDAAVDQSRKILTRMHHGEEDFTMVDQEAMLSTMGSILDTLSYILAGIAAISLVVGGIGIMNILLVSVTERTREVGLRMAVGARRRDILKQFVTESVVLGFLGGALGIAAGLAGNAALGMLSDKFQPAVSAGTVAFAAGFSIVLGLLFGVYPAWRAAALDPILALRRE